MFIRGEDFNVQVYDVRRTLSDGKNSHDFRASELKKQRYSDDLNISAIPRHLVILPVIIHAILPEIISGNVQLLQAFVV